MNRVANEREQEEFLEALAQYLAGDQAHMSILLQMQRPEAKVWAKLRGTTPLFGYPTVAEATKELRKFLFNRD